METPYILQIVTIAKERLRKADRPLSDKELCRHIVSILKKRLGKKDRTHSSKERFRKQVFPDIVCHERWGESIIEISPKKYGLIGWDFKAYKNEAVLEWKEQPLSDATQKMLELLRRMNAYKLEELVASIIERKFSYNVKVTKKSGDQGIDLIAERLSYDSVVKGKKEIMLVQVKQFKGTVSRPEANKFKGAVDDYLKKDKWASFTGLFITTGKFSDGFESCLKCYENTGINFCRWDGRELVENLLTTGIGVKYSVDKEYWNGLDPSLEKRIKV